MDLIFLPHSGSQKIQEWVDMNIFEFQDFKTYLHYVRENYPGARGGISLERWSKKLGYKSPRSIAMVLNGQRAATNDMVLAISTDLNHSANERRYFELLSWKDKYIARGTQIPPAIAEELHQLNPKIVKRKPIEADLLAYVSDWYHLPIKQLVESKKFKEDPEWIAKKFRGKVTAKEVQDSIKVMLNLKILERNPQTNALQIPDNAPLITHADIPSMAVRRHMLQQMDRAKEALNEQALFEREFTNLTFRMHRSRINDVKKAIREFRDKFDKDFALDNGDDVCQLNIQFFFHSKED